MPGITKKDRRTAARINADRQAFLDGDIQGIVKAYKTFCGSQHNCTLCPYNESTQYCIFAYIIGHMQYYGILPPPDHKNSVSEIHQ